MIAQNRFCGSLAAVKSPLYGFWCEAVRPQRCARWVWDPAAGLWFMSDWMRDTVGALHNEYRFHEIRSWLLDLDEGVDKAMEQLKIRNSCTLVSTIRMPDGTTQRWMGHARFVTCTADMPPVCLPSCKLARCRIIVGASERMTDVDASPRSPRQQPG